MRRVSRDEGATVAVRDPYERQFFLLYIPAGSILTDQRKLCSSMLSTGTQQLYPITEYPMGTNDVVSNLGRDIVYHEWDSA
jgi:hypothetical protein